MELTAFVADPIAVGTIIGALALVMFPAPWHKLCEREVFAGGVCDYRKPAVSQQGTIPWLGYGDAERPIYGGAPLPRQIQRG